MRFVIDLDTLYLIESTTDKRPVSSVSGKRGDGIPFEVVFSRSGVIEELAADSVLTFGAKEEGNYDDEAVVLQEGFTKTGTGVDTVYSASPSFNTTALNDLFLVDADASNDPPHLDLMAEFTWRVGDAAPTSTKTFRFRVHNDVVRGTEGTPVGLPTPEAWLYARTAALTYAGADPNIPETLTVTGITSPSGHDPLVLERVADDGGWHKWEEVGDSDTISHHIGANWQIIIGSEGDYSASKASTADNPVGLTGWAVSSGTGQPIFTGDAPVALFTGQLCKASTAWWIWSGSAWVPFATLDGSPVAYNATLSAYRKLTVSGADGSEIITIAAL